jgi:hypothetical protein
LINTGDAAAIQLSVVATTAMPLHHLSSQPRAKTSFLVGNNQVPAVQANLEPELAVYHCSALLKMIK